MHHLNGSGLRCAPGPALCTTTCAVHHGAQGGPTSVRSIGVAPDIFHLLVVHMEHAQNGHFLSVFGGAWAHSIVFLWLTMNMEIKIHNVVLYQRTLW